MTSTTETSQAQTNQASASPSSFYAAMRILPSAQRDAMFLIYSFCRQVDDIADSALPPERKRQELQQWRKDIDAVYTGKPPSRLAEYPVTIKRFDLQREDFLAIIDGMEMDAAEDIRGPDWATLDLYCDRVASAVGRLSVNVFGLARKDGVALAHHLGRALQLTNILRDIDEDASIGRLYLPREALSFGGISTTDPSAVVEADLTKACEPVIARARQHYQEAQQIMSRSSRKLVRAPRIMGKYYGRILDLLIARGFAMPRAPVRLGKLARLSILLRYAFV
ncbi:presqualene diphosphate synthase HpnD [Bradyrhizobium sp. LHD-71]|uniref:presqualene diphosphate synthase HpnD n=1 Tax=Bradyrhizobium sp. LHD-71 TaxID=3072141 RepID=UPI00280DA02D|nr:presqualene diphosphate synthase HpnD [Bradyrhizobium sp. LHD-71]MDQ8727745.1 presqualene diphosphate synthase HpnD [Bradyrhizobium sp. LHD-71]